MAKLAILLSILLQYQIKLISTSLDEADIDIHQNSDPQTKGFSA